MRSSVLAATVAGSVFALPMLSLAQTTMAPASDASFVRNVAVSDMFEIEASKLAESNGSSADVKTFASRMVSDHTKTTDQLKSLVSNKQDLKVPTSMDALHKIMLGRLRAAKGKNFDLLYTQQQIKAHTQAVTLFTSESQAGKDDDLKKFANDTLPTLQEHRSMAQQLLKGGGTP